MQLQQVKDQVKQRADDSLSRVLSFFLSKLEERSKTLGCSYKAWLNTYAFICKKMKESGYDHTKTKLTYEDVKRRLYANPCKNCEVCNTRRKAWPV